MSIGVIRFPGTNCDRDIYHAIELAGGKPEYIWWNNDNISGYDAVVIPGGFSYRDYLRAGAIASNTPVAESVKELVKEEKPVLGICNGAQILGELNLVPGIFITNEIPRFNCEWVDLKVKTNRTPFTSSFKKDEIVQIPIAHAEGRFYSENLESLYDNDQIVLQFKDKNPNGSLDKITGVCDESGFVCAMMPHPERASEDILGSSDGLEFFKGMLKKI